MPQALLMVLGAIGAAIAARFIAREWRRVNDELDRTRTATVDAREGIPVLRRDPETGIYRPMR
jgi:hypothetical protein